MGTVGFGLSSGGGGSSAFTPTDLSGLKLWLKADSLSLNDGDPVSTWTDSSGNGNDGAGSLTARPLYKTGVYNSLPMVRGDGSNDFLTVSRNAGLEPNAVTIFAVFRASSSPAGFSHLFSKPVGSDYSWGFNCDVSSNFRAFAHAASTGFVLTSSQAAASVWNGVPHVACLKANGSNLNLYFDGHNFGDVTASGNVQYDTGDIHLFGDGASLNAAADIGEVLIYNTALSDVNRWKVLGYLGVKWGVA